MRAKVSIGCGAAEAATKQKDEVENDQGVTVDKWLMDRPNLVPSPAGFVVKSGLNIFSFTSGDVCRITNDALDAQLEKREN